MYKFGAPDIRSFKQSILRADQFKNYPVTEEANNHAEKMYWPDESTIIPILVNGDDEYIRYDLMWISHYENDHINTVMALFTTVERQTVNMHVRHKDTWCSG